MKMDENANKKKVNKGVHTTGQENVSDVATVSTEEGEHSASIKSGVCAVQNPTELKYEKIGDTTTTTSDLTEDVPLIGESQKKLYLMNTGRKKMHSSPSRIEFKLYKSRNMPRMIKRKRSECRKSCNCSNTNALPKVDTENNFINSIKTVFARIRRSPSHERALNKNTKDDYVERIDIYCFDHGDFTYFRTTDYPPQIASEVLANQTTHYATRFWAEIFGSLHIGVTFFVTFFMQTYRFLLYSIVRPIIVGFLQMTSDYFVKPILTIFFNAFLQPPLTLMYNIFSSIKDTLEPVAITIGNFLKPIATLLRAFRLVSFTTRKTVEKLTVENA